jgi:hypothetical protein
VVPERERLIARIRQMRRTARIDAPAAPPSASAPEQDRLRALQTRVEHLEALLQGLQDSVHRDSLRRDKQFAELEARLQPAALGRALSDDARARGL